MTLQCKLPLLNQALSEWYNDLHKSKDIMFYWTNDFYLIGKKNSRDDYRSITMKTDLFIKEWLKLLQQLRQILGETGYNVPI
ncbi:hypothetical protein B1B04_13695 [Lysinibacillus sp. KCTC 33748]|uniref:hypothetical protein n=1 Tax=unclassified Lysinibacillus TaxID=2636778 RepID=UPI0009A5EB1C|nr:MULTISPECIES: hypothetical protein [unclassified Lysinibacillus]OXS73013.1 hypothetical protein B1B04_13695 [Lysinibacillus sp. KCTC 33748]SKB85970.1 hypothetical protein SAMN06295926_11056 [Lysinibacillus sp. AC-3]